MFRGFRIDVSESVKLNTELNDVCTDKNVKKYQDFCSQYYQEVNAGLENYIKNGILSASEITSKWFPKVNADVFLSHSHQDEVFVTRFAVWLYSVGIRAFIDSNSFLLLSCNSLKDLVLLSISLLFSSIIFE